jgi:hypothetical protein
MTARDVSDTLALALEASGLESVNVKHRPRLLSDNGPSYVSAELRDWLAERGMAHTRGRPYQPMTQGKIERWHRSLKNQVLLENYYLPGDLKARIGEFADYFNTECYHESLDNLTPADVYTGRGQTVLLEGGGSSRKRSRSVADYTTDRKPPEVRNALTTYRLIYYINQFINGSYRIFWDLIRYSAPARASARSPL